VSIELPDLDLDAPQDVPNMPGLRESLPDRVQNDLLDQATPNEQLVFAVP
jgi:hypothetical protein